ncbi:VOC family protein [Streptomyces sp. NPDC051064]|uniref:VOC family protein n=1 Tax=Streptomyces sp. NPDC051064 TaxID=3365641 RepID=UPI00378D9FDE
MVDAVILVVVEEQRGGVEDVRVRREGPVDQVDEVGAVAGRGVGGLGLRIGDTDLGLVAKTNPGTGAAPRILLSISVDDVDETLGRVTALGGSVRSGPRNMPWGQRVAHIQDPDGNPVNLTQPIPTQ